MSSDPERTFLHDLASPVTALQITLAALVEDLGEGSEEAEQAKLALSLTERIATMLKARRSALQAESRPPEGTP